MPIGVDYDGYPSIRSQFGFKRFVNLDPTNCAISDYIVSKTASTYTPFNSMDPTGTDLLIIRSYSASF